jgi:Kef-type K+ transport system membrane component KefB
MGSRLNIGVFNGRLIVSALFITFLAVLSKLVGCGLPVLRSGWSNALKVGIGMVPRGEVGLIVALIGLQMSVISEQAYALVIFMTAGTTMIAPPLLKIVFRDEMRIPPPTVLEPAATLYPAEEPPNVPTLK